VSKIPDLIDIGANLTHDTFDVDREDVIRRAAEAGVNRLIITGGSEQGSRDALQLAEKYPGQMYATAGVHPHHASDYSDSAHQTLAELLGHDAVVAVGECGLDYFRNFSPVAAQRDAFQRQLELAEESGLPVFLHQRDAHDDFIEILQPMLLKMSRAVAHCFTGGEKELREYIDMGLYIGITGWICDERRGAHLQEIVGLIPDDRLMLETDAPYLLPRSLSPRPKTRRNEPYYLREVLRVVAESMGRTEEDIARITRENAERFFGIGV
jgi:TatD DNase family protein